MTRYSWPGNVRELQNRVKRGVIMADRSRVTAKDLELEPDRGVESLKLQTTLREAREQVEREMVEQALKRNSGKITSAAADLGISRPTLYELMEKLGIGKERATTNIKIRLDINLMQSSKFTFRIGALILAATLIAGCSKEAKKRAFLARRTLISKRVTMTKPSWPTSTRCRWIHKTRSHSKESAQCGGREHPFAQLGF